VLTTEERVEVVNVVNGFNDGSIDMKPIYEEEERLRQIISDGRRRLSTVKISREQLGYLCEQAAKGECEGQRAEISAARIALAVAALRKRDAVTPDDLRVAVQLAIIPRLRVIPVMVEEMPPPPPQYTPSPPGPEAGGHEQDESSQQEQQMVCYAVLQCIQ
jgi:magnesium chelatase subunit D